MEQADDRVTVVTGAAGFIGGRVAQKFAETGRPVVAMDLPGTSFAHLDDAITTLRADITNAAGLESALAGLKPGLVVHCAALMGGWGKPEAYERVNVDGTRNVCRWAGNNQASRLIYMSSVTVYGLPPRTGVDEETPFRSIGLPYADSKMKAEQVVRAAHEEGLAATILRPGDVYGPRAHEWVVKLVDSMKANRMILIGGGSGVVNTTYVDNLVDAVEAAETRAESAGRDYIITDGPPTTWKDYLQALAEAAEVRAPRISLPTLFAWPLVIGLETAGRITGARPPLTRMGLRLLTTRVSYDIARARRELNWEPRVDLSRGMSAVGRWLNTLPST